MSKLWAMLQGDSISCINTA